MLSLSLLVGCALGPDFVRPKPPPVDRYTVGEAQSETPSADGQAQHFTLGAEVNSDWWRLFHSPKVDAIMKEAIANNQNLQAAQASLRQSQESLRAGYGVFYPQIDGNFNATRQKFSPARFGSTTPASIFNLYTLSVSSSYTLDLFGEKRRAVESLKAQVDYQRYTAAATYLSLSGCPVFFQ